MSKGQAEVINDLMRKISGGIRVAMPASIESYDFKTQKADIKIDMQELYQNGTSLDYPVLSGVPIIFPRCGGASITMPISRGDTCLVMFLDRDSTAWLLGGKNVKPKSMRSHHLSDAVAIMGLCPFTNKSPAKNNTDMLISFDGSFITLKPKGIIDITSAKEINVKTEGVIINCKNANVTAEESIDVTCKNVTVKASSNLAVECQNANIKVTEILNAQCQTLTAKVSESAQVECQNASIKASSTINTETPNFTQKGNMKIDGMLEVTGTSLLRGKLTSQNGIENSGANLISNGKVLETHTHTYQDVTTVIAPDGPCTVTKVPTNSGQTN
jgi:phage baseplate assembly protein gpV